jgi:hypothetical protein
MFIDALAGDDECDCQRHVNWNANYYENYQLYENSNANRNALAGVCKSNSDADGDGDLHGVCNANGVGGGIRVRERLNEQFADAIKITIRVCKSNNYADGDGDFHGVCNANGVGGGICVRERLDEQFADGGIKFAISVENSSGYAISVDNSSVSISVEISKGYAFGDEKSIKIALTFTLTVALTLILAATVRRVDGSRKFRRAGGQWHRYNRAIQFAGGCVR